MTKNFRDVPVYVGIVQFLRANKVAEADGGKADEGEVQRIEIIPAL